VTGVRPGCCDADEGHVVNGLVPMSVAGKALVDPVRVTVIVPPFTAAAITWLLVTTRPFVVINHSGALILWPHPSRR